MMSLQMVLVSHLMSYLTNEVHTSLHHAGTLLSIVLIGGMFGRILLAWASDNIFKGNRIIPLQITIVMTVLLLLCTSYVMTYMIFGILVILCFFLVSLLSVGLVYLSFSYRKDQIRNLLV